MLSANAFNLVQSKDLLFGKELNIFILHLFRNKFLQIISLPNDKILEQYNLKYFADDKINVIYVKNLVLGRAENIVGKGENAGYQHFLLFPQCFQKASLSGSLRVRIVRERVKLIFLDSALQELHLVLAPNVWANKNPSIDTPWNRTQALKIARPTIYLKTTDTIKVFFPIEDKLYHLNHIALSQTTNLDSSKLKEFADDSLELDENSRKFSKQVENTVGKGEIARPSVFSKDLYCRHVKNRACLGKG